MKKLLALLMAALLLFAAGCSAIENAARGALDSAVSEAVSGALSELDESFMTNYVISMELDQLKKAERAIGIAGGARKFQAILGALRGKLINILVTDQFTAKKLLDFPGL